MTTVLVLPENMFNVEVYSRSTWFHFELNLSRFAKIILTNKKNPEYFLKYSRKKTKI